MLGKHSPVIALALVVVAIGAVATVRMPYDPGERIPLSNGTLLI